MHSAENDTIRTQLNHRTIRAFTDEPVDDRIIDTLMDVARHAPTSSFYQQTTVIRVSNPAARQAVYEASGQPYVGGTQGELFVFVVDLYRNARIREEAGVSVAPLESAALFFEGAEDTLIAAQNVVVAAESLGLGTVYLGSIGGNSRLVINTLKLPSRTYPLVGLLVGHPDQEPELKPRLPREFTIAVDTYPVVENYHEALSGYDDVVQTYYDLRDTNRRIDSFTTQISNKLGTGRAELAGVIEVLAEQKLALH